MKLIVLLLCLDPPPTPPPPLHPSPSLCLSRVACAMRKRRPTKNGQTVAKLKQLPPTGFPFLKQLLLGGFFVLERERERDLCAGKRRIDRRERGGGRGGKIIEEFAHVEKVKRFLNLHSLDFFLRLFSLSQLLIASREETLFAQRIAENQ